MVSEKLRLRVLEKGDLDAIHGATMEVLENTGARVESDEALGILEESGFDIDRKSKRVRMTESKVMEAVKSCRKDWRWAARSEKHTLDMVDGRTKFGPGAQCLLYMDPWAEEVRPATLNDGILSCRLLDALDSCSLGYIPIYPHDVPGEAMSIVMWMAGLVNSSKPTYGSTAEEYEWELMMRITEILFGKREALGKLNPFPGYIDPVSPLGHDRGMTETLLRHARNDSPVFVMVMALAGGTAPASLAGLLVQQNAEIMSSIAMARCVQKAPKIVYGSVSCPLDMRSGTSATGAPEFSLLGVGAIQLANYYHLPSDVGAQSDSKTVDAQTTYEKTQSALTAVLAGADFADLFLGSTESFNMFSPIQLMIDDEIASNVTRIAQGIEVNEDTLSTGVMSRTGPLGDFLKQKETLGQFRREHMQAKLSDRSTRQQWTTSGSVSTHRRARKRMEALLRTHVPDPIKPELRKDIDSLIAKYTKGYDLRRLETVDSQH